MLPLSIRGTTKLLGWPSGLIAAIGARISQVERNRR